MGIKLNNSFYVFVAVRMKSSRLHFKAMQNISGQPLIKRLVERISEIIPLNRIVLCTSLAAQDDAIQKFADQNKINCFRGHELDVMERFLEAAKLYNAKIIARVTGDNPLTDPFVMLEMLQHHEKNNSEYTYNNEIPIGTRTEIIDVSTLSRIHSQLSDPLSSEYMTYMLNRPDKLKTSEYKVSNHILKRPEICLTVDTESDFKAMQEVYNQFKGSPPSLEKIIEWIDSKEDNNYSFKEDVNSTLSKDVDCSFASDLKSL
jgi:spore coat polysaccharide biosynthesis protein SpsF (cytidylyltransferase family)